MTSAAIDRVARAPFEEALVGRVAEPLGLGSLGLGPPPRIWGHRPRLQLGPIVAGRSAPADPGDPRGDNPPLLTPAGRMHLSIADWGAFHRLFLGRGRPLLADDTVRHLLEVPDGGRGSMAMGWASAKSLGASFGMQGSNTMWSATALIDREMKRTAMVVANDGRTSILQRSALLARELLDGSPR